MKTLDPKKTICIIKHNGKEVGRIPATARNASAYINELVLNYKTGVTMEHVEDENAELLSFLLT